MKKTMAAGFVSLLMAVPLVQATITQDFSTITETRQIDVDGADNESRTLSSVWGGYNGVDQSAANTVRLWTDGTRATGSGAGTPVLWFRNGSSASMQGAYAYTIFSDTGSGTPSHSIDLSGGNRQRFRPAR